LKRGSTLTPVVATVSEIRTSYLAGGTGNSMYTIDCRAFGWGPAWRCRRCSAAALMGDSRPDGFALHQRATLLSTARCRATG